jgi:hypothetical protein
MLSSISLRTFGVLGDKRYVWALHRVVPGSFELNIQKIQWKKKYHQLGPLHPLLKSKISG